MTASQPFTSEVVMSQKAAFKHEWIWKKNRGSNFANTVREPMKEHESVLVFAKGPWTYNPQRQKRNGSGLERAAYKCTFDSRSTNYRDFERREANELTEDRVPSSVQSFNTETGLHPTQKPQKLFEYLVMTYTNEGDIVCDPFGGSGTTAAAAQNTGRRYVSIEAREDYCETQRQRLVQRLMF
jgi:site-specific DNA-methyltransferase (adenine-specific)